ncbi:aminoacylase-1 isoform X1 [Stomoxys calcitrans]|uniref:aminoacylase-1 isoform X1 n=1 Tax=Stomoxys calcitrans TaxID=35570 RepID=UPI0027E2531C|nr:aminoacylase-1 isoform X1 [Stomoxys calcitrans]
MPANWEDNEEIQYFREYLRIPTVHPNPDYKPCVAFLKKQAAALDMPVRLFYPVNEDNPIVVMTLTGTDPSLPCILLNSHMDVVPVFAENWKHKPFGAEMDEEGKIYARGAQDMKCVGMQYLGALRALKKKGVQFRRTIHVTFVADEEMGGGRGMRPFVETADFKELKIGFSLDEGLASPTEEFPVFYAERSVWRLYFNANGNAGHGSLLHKNTAGEKITYILHKMMSMREQQVRRLENNPELTIGDVTTINLTQIRGGVQSNVVPPTMVLGFDVRLALDVDHSEFEAQLHKWCEEAGGDIHLTYDQKQPRVTPTATDNTNPYWVAFKEATDSLSLKLKPQIFTGGTDSRYIRRVGIPAIGFSPMNNTPVLLHDHDEFIAADIYLRGIEIYEKIITNLANC